MDTHTVQCPGCAAALVLQPGHAAYNCPHCGCPLAAAPQTPPPQNDACAQQARAAYARGSYADAHALWQQSCQQNPTNPEALLGRFKCALHMDIQHIQEKRGNPQWPNALDEQASLAIPCLPDQTGQAVAGLMRQRDELVHRLSHPTQHVQGLTLYTAAQIKKLRLTQLLLLAASLVALFLTLYLADRLPKPAGTLGMFLFLGLFFAGMVVYLVAMVRAKNAKLAYYGTHPKLRAFRLETYAAIQQLDAQMLSLLQG